MDRADVAAGAFLSFIWSVFVFLLHVSVVYLVAHFCIPWLGGRLHDLPAVIAPAPNESSFQFLFNHILTLSVICGAAAALATGPFAQRAMRWVWLVPAVVLAYKFTTYPSTLLQDRFAEAFHHYFAAGFLVPEFHSYREMFAQWSPEHARGLDQMRFTAPLYVGLSYAIFGWIVMHFDLSARSIWERFWKTDVHRTNQEGSQSH